MPTTVHKLIDDPRLRLGVLELEGGEVRVASAELRVECAALAQRMGSAEYEAPEELRRAVRGMLKIGGFSPTGRNRPAQELLLNDLKERMAGDDPLLRGFHHINNVVDCNNLVSLELGLPISIFDAAKLGGELCVRIGQEGEGYVFNASGHLMDLKRCIICARGAAPGQPCGSPVKDGMECKVFDGATDFLAIIYAAAELVSTEQLEAGLERFGELLMRESGASVAAHVLL